MASTTAAAEAAIAPEPDSSRLGFFDGVIRDWLADHDATLIAGRWSEGSITELRPRGKATLSQPRYSGRHAGLRDLWLEDAEHHMHMDLARFTRAAYVIAPSVCFGFKPSFEVRLLGAAVQASEAPAADASFALAVGHPYRAGALDMAAVRRYFDRLAAHARARADLVQLRVLRDAQRPLTAAVAEPLCALAGEMLCALPEGVAAELGAALADWRAQAHASRALEQRSSQ